jgi:hypothetical protein
MRDRRRRQGFREFRISVPDARAAVIRKRVAQQVAGLSPAAEQDALSRTEAVSEFDEAR